MKKKNADYVLGKIKTPKQKMELVANPEGVAAALAMFRRNTDGVSPGLKVKSRSPMLKPSQFPEGRILSGIVKRLIRCVSGKNEDGSDKYGCLIEIVPEMNSVGVAIPATATLSGPLEITQKGAGASTEFSTPYIGHTIEIEKLPDKIPSKKGQSAWSFLVALSEKPVIVE